MTDADIIRITPRALENIHYLKSLNKDPEEIYLRIGSTGGGCGVAQRYIIGFDRLEKTDKILDIEGLQCVVNIGQLLQLQGLEIDWVQREQQQGFSFQLGNKT